MKKIFNIGKKGQSSSSSFKLPNYLSDQTPFRLRYQARSKDLGKIHKAALLGKLEKVQQLLLLGKGTVNELDKRMRTPLHLASANGHPDIVSFLTERKCELNFFDDQNKTPLMRAIETQNEACATILLEHGADPNLKDGKGNTILHYIASSENKFMAEKLIKYKINIEAKNKDGLTPLMMAVKAKNDDMVTILLKNGANVNAMDNFKRTALMLAVSVEALGLVTLLFQNNADHTLKDSDGWTAEQYAKLYGYPVYVYHKQVQKQMIQNEKLKEQIEQQEPSTSQIRTSAPSLDKKAQENIVEDVISRCSDGSGSLKSWKSTDDEMDFDKKEQPKLNLVKLMNAKISGETSSSVSTKVTTALEDNQLDNEKKDLTDSFAKSSSQAHCSTHAVVHASPAHFSQSSLNKPTLLGIFKEYPRDSEEAKENDVFVKNDTDNQIYPNIPGQLQAHNTSEKHAERKATKSTSKRSKEEAKSSWDSKCSVENPLEGSSRHLASTNQNINKSISLGREDHPGKNRNVKPSQSGLPMKDSSTSQQSEKGVKPKQKLAFMEKVVLSVAEDTDDGSNWDSPSTSEIHKSHKSSKILNLGKSNVGKSLRRALKKLGPTRTAPGSGPAVENPSPQKQCEPPLEKGAQKDHPGKNHNVKPSQCGLPMKDSSTSQELEKSDKPKPKLAFMEKVDLSVAEDTDDRPGKNRNVKPSQSGLPMKDSSTSQQSEKGVKPKQKLGVMGKIDLTAAENTEDGSNWDSPSTSEIHKSHKSSKILNLGKSNVGKSLRRALKKLGPTRTAPGSGPAVENPSPQKQCEPPLEKGAQKDHPGKNHNVKPSQCGLPMKDSSTNQELEKSDKPKPKLAFMEKVDLSVAEDTDDRPGKNRNVKPSQSGPPMKDSYTSQQSEKGVKAKQKLGVMGKIDLTAAENTEDGSNWDSPSTSEIHKSHKSSKILNLGKSDVGKSLRRALKKLGPTRTAPGSGPAVENPSPQKQCEPPLEKEAQKDHPGKNHNVKTSQSGLPMKDSSTSQQSEKGVKAKQKLDGSNWDSPSTSEIHKSHKSAKILNLRRSDVGKSLRRALKKLGSTRTAVASGPEEENPGPQKQCEPLLEKEAQKDHPGKNRNVKTSQSGLPMKDSSTNQESEKGVKGKATLEVKGKVELTAAENTDDNSNWDSPSTSEIHKSHKTAKILNLQRSDVGKSLRRALKNLGSTRTAVASGPEVENPGPQKQCEPPLEKGAQKDHPGENRNVKTSQSGLPMKDSSTNQESEKGIKAKQKLDVMGNFDLTAAENTDDNPRKNHNVKPSQCGLPMKDSSTSQESEKVVKPKQKLAFMEKVDLSAAENTDDHPGKNRNVKPNQCDLPMKDTSTRQESEKVVKAKPKLAFMEKVDLSAAEYTDDHPGKNPNVQPRQCDLPMKDCSTRQELEKSFKPKPKLAFMEKVDLSAAEDTDDHQGKNRNVKPSQCGLPMKDSSTSQELEKSVKPKPKLAFMEKVDLSAAEDTDDHPGKNRNVKTSQSSLPMKDSSTSQQSEKGVKEKQKLEVMGKVDLTAAENTDDGSNWDSPSTSEIHKSHKSSKFLNLGKSDVGKSLRRALKKLGPTRTAPGSGPEVENPDSQKQCEPPLEKAQKDHPGKNRNVKTSQSGLPMKDSSTSQESERLAKTIQKLEVMGKADLTAAENTDGGSNWDSTSTSEIHKSHRTPKILNLRRSDVGKSLRRALKKLGSTRTAAGSGPEVENPGPQKQCEPPLEKEAQKDHPGKNRNVKPNQCGLPMKDSSTSQQSEKVVKAKQNFGDVEIFDLTAAENTDDGSNWDSTSTSAIHKSHRTSKTLNLQRTDVGKSLPMTGSGPDTGYKVGVQVENPDSQKQCEPPLEKAQKDHTGKNPNMKTSQSGLPMKDSSTNQESEKGVKAKTKLAFMEKVDLTAAENTDDSSNWDSTSTSAIHKSPRTSKTLNLQRTDVGKSLPMTGIGPDTGYKVGVQVENPDSQKQYEPPLEKAQKDHTGKNPNMKPSQSGLPMKDSSTNQESEKGVKAKPTLAFMEKVDLTAAENTDDGSNWDSTSTSAIHKSPRTSKTLNLQRTDVGKSLPMTGIGPDTGYKVGVQVENPDSQKQYGPPLEKAQKDHTGKNPNMKPSQSGLPMKDSSTNQESEKGVKAKPTLAFMEKVDLTAAENTDDGSNWDSTSTSAIHKSPRTSKTLNLQRTDVGKSLPMTGIGPGTGYKVGVQVENPDSQKQYGPPLEKAQKDHTGKNPNMKPSQSGLPMKDSSTNQESEKGVKAKPTLAFMEKVDLTAAENTDDGSNWDSTSTSAIHKSPRTSKTLNLQRTDVGKSLPMTGIGPGTGYKVGVQVENPDSQKQYGPPLEKAQKDHTGKNPNKKPSQSGLPMKDSSTNQESEKGVKAKPTLAFMEKVDLTAAENTDDGSNWDSTSTSAIHKSPRTSKTLNLQRTDVGKSLPMTGIGPGTGYKVGVQVENPDSQKQYGPPLEKAQKDHTGKNPNMKPSQSGLPMKDSSTNQESEKGVKAKPTLAFMEKVDLTAAENTDDGSNWDSTSTSAIHKCHRSSKNLNLQRTDVGKSFGTLNKLGSTRAAAGSGPEVENPGPQKQCEPLLVKGAPKDLMQKPEFKGSSDRNQGSFDQRNQGQCFPENLLTKFERRLKDNSSLGQHEGHLSRNSNEKPIQSTLQTSQEVVKRSKEKPELDTSTWDSPDTYEINDRHKSSMHLKLQRTHACTSLSQSKNQLASTEFPFKKAEVAATGSGSDTRSKVRVEKPVPQEHYKPPIRKEKQEEDLNREMEFKTSLGPSQERFNQDQGKVTLQTTSITEQTTPKNQIKSRCAPFLNQKRISQGLESNIKFHGDDMPLGPQRNWKESCEKICVKEEKIVKSKFRMNQTGIYGETREKDNIADQPKEKLQKDDFENKSEEELSDTSSSATLTYMSDPREKKKEEELSETSSSATLTYMSNPREKKKEKSPYGVDFQSIPGQLSNNMCSKKSTSQFKNDSKPKTKYTSKVNEENVASVAKNIIKVDSKIDINGIKEDRPSGTEMTYSQHRNISSVEPNSGNLFQSNCPESHFGGQLIQSDNMESIIQEEKPKVTSPRKCKKKTKHLEPLPEYNYYDDYNSIYEPSDEMDSLSYWDQVSRMYLNKDIGEDIKRYRNELKILQAEALTLEKLKKQKEVEKKRQEHQQKKMETLRRKDGNSTESHHHGKEEENKIPGKEMSTFSEEYLVFTQILSRLAKKIFNKKNEDKVEMAEDAVDDLTQAHATGSVCVQTSEKIVVTSSLSIKQQKNTRFVKITRVLDSIQSTVRETQERIKTQSSLKHECDKEHHRSRLEGEEENREKPQSEIKIISYKSSAIYQKHQTLKEKNQDSLFIKNRIDGLSNRYSKAKNELRKLVHDLKVKTSLIEKTQKQVQQVKDKVKKRRLENHMLKEKFNRAVLQEELLRERIREMQKEMPQPSENAQKKGAFIKEAFKNIGKHFRDRSVTVDADIEEQDHVAEEISEQIRKHVKELEERNEQIRIHEKELEEERKKQIRKHEKELEERNEQIRKHVKELEERNEQIRIHEKELEEERKKKIRKHEKELEERNEQIRKHEKELEKERKERIRKHEKELEKERKERIRKHEKELEEERKKQIRIHEKELEEERKKQIRIHEKELEEERKKQIRIYEKELEKERNEQIRKHEKELEERNEQIRKHEKELEEERNERIRIHEKELEEERKKQIRIYEKELEEDEETIRKLQEQVAESQKETFIFSQTALEMKQIWKKYERECELYENQQQDKRKKQYIKDIEDYLLKLKSATENSGEQSSKNEELWDATNSYFEHVRSLEDKVEAESSKRFMLELLFRKLQEEATALQSLRDSDDNLKWRRKGI